MIYPLWSFAAGVGRPVVITRGSTVEIAMKHAARAGCWRRGETIYALDWNRIGAAELYNINHAPGWLYRIPNYEKDRRYER